MRIINKMEEKKMKKKAVGLWLSVVLTVGMLAGCGGGSGEIGRAHV